MYKKMFSKPTGQSESGIKNHPDSSPLTSKYYVLFKHNGSNYIYFQFIHSFSLYLYFIIEYFYIVKFHLEIK
jgi:hypothetical protein